MTKKFLSVGARGFLASMTVLSLLVVSNANAFAAPPQSGGESPQSEAPVVSSFQSGEGEDPLPDEGLVVPPVIEETPEPEEVSPPSEDESPVVEEASPTEEVEIYNDPSHADVTWVPDPATGEMVPLYSGITSWVEEAPSSVPMLARAMRASADYASVFPSIELVNFPPNGLLGTDGVATFRINLDIPADARAGDQYTLSINSPLWLHNASISNREISDAQGRVFAVTDAGAPATGVASASRSMVFTLTEAVEEHAEITGFIEVTFYGQFATTEQTVTANLSSPDGTALGPNQPIRIPASNPLVSAYSTSDGAVLDNRAGVNPAITVIQSDMRAGFSTTFTPVSSGLTPRGCDFIGVTEQGFNTSGFWQTFDISPQMTCVEGANGSITLTFPNGISPIHGLSNGGYRINYGGFFADQPGELYTIRMSTNATSGTLATPFEGTIRSGTPVGDGASHLYLNTTKTASYTTQHDNTKPTVGDVITYVITTTPGAENDRAIRNVVTTDKLPAGLIFLSASGGGVYNSTTREVVWGPRTLTSTGRFVDTIKAEVTASAPATVTNTVTNTAEGGVCGDGDNISVCSDSAATPTAMPGFGFTKDSRVEDTNGNGHIGDEGDTVFFDFTVTNNGEVTISTALLSDSMLGISGHECLTAPLAPGATVACAGSFSHVITAADVEVGQIHNEATLCVDPILGLECKDDETTVPLVDPAFTFEKHARLIPAHTAFPGQEGDEIEFTFWFKNTGTTPITNPTITDDLLGLNDVACAPAGQTLAPGASVTCENTYRYAITAADVAAGKVINHAVGKVPGLPDVPDQTQTPTIAPGYSFVKSSELQDANENGWFGDKGDKVVFTFKVTNTGNTPIVSALLSDSLLGISDHECLVAPLLPGITVECAGSFSHTITEADVEAGKIHNEATLCVPGLPCEDDETTQPLIDPGFTFEKHSELKPVDPSFPGQKGDTIKYWFVFKNTGNVDITNPTITDDLLGLDDVACAPAGQTLAPGASVTCENTFTHVITAADVAAGKVINHAVGKVPGLPDVPDEETTPTIDPGFDFEKSSKLVDANENGWIGDEGDEVVFSFTVTNTGNVTITSALLTDSRLGITDHECLTAPLAAGASVECAGSFSHTITAGDVEAGKVINEATLCVPGLPCEDDTTTQPTIDPGFDFEKSSKLVDANENGWIGDEGDEVVFSFTVTNTGNVPITNVTITDDLLGLSDVPCAPVGQIIEPGVSVTCTNTYRYIITASDVEAGWVINHAVGKVPGLPDVPDEETTPTIDPGYGFTKESDLVDANENGWIGDEGDEVVFSFTVTNTGNVTITSALLTDSRLGITDHECLTAPLAAGASVECAGSFSHTITAGDVEAGKVINEATLCVPGLPCEDDTTTQPTIDPGFDFEKSSKLVDANENGWIGDEGDEVVFSFTVTNTGNVPITSALLTDDVLGITDHECLTGPLAPGETVECAGEFVHTITAGDVEAGFVHNQATLCVPGLPCEEDETEQPTIDPGFEFDKFIVEIRTPDGKVVTSASKGDLIHYGFSATNTGNVDIETLTVHDAMLGVDGIECLPEDTLLLPGETVDCVDNAAYIYTVTAADVEAGQVHNVAIGKVPGLPDDDGEATVPILPDPVPGQPGGTLPKTGAAGTWIMIGAGSAALISGIYMVARKRRADVKADLPA